jgi:alkylation response protein AidB-like acyl-CoA dehydrogenase
MADARIPKENLLGEQGRGHVIAFNILNVGRFKLGAGCVGGSKVALDDALHYAQEREQFKTPLVKFPLIAGKLAQMAARTFAAESATYRTAGLLDEAVAAVDHAAPDKDAQVIAAIEEFGIECSIIKVFGSEVLDYCVDECVQIFGGYGYVNDYPAERYYRDSRINRIYEGTNEINRMLIPGMILKRAMKGQLPLLAAAKGVQDALMEIPDFGVEIDRAPFEVETEAAEKLKKAVLLVAGVAAQKYGPKIGDEQEVLSWVSEMIIEVYGLESAALRARKLAAAGKNGGYFEDLLAIISYEAIERAGRAGREALCHISEGDDLRMQLAGLKRFTKTEPVDTAAVRRRIAEQLVERGGYKI